MFHAILKSCYNTPVRYSGQILSLRQYSSGIDYVNLINKSKIVVFLKGTPGKPRCGFSARVCKIFEIHGVQYDAYDVLENMELREGIKKFSNWPTIPQVYINGEFVGGSDILLDKHESGELIKILERAGIESALLDKEDNPKSET